MIFSFVGYSENSIIASTRIARYLSEVLKLPVVDHRNIGAYAGKKLPVLYIVNGAYAFCKCLPELAALIVDAKKLVWIQNDYTIHPPNLVGDAETPFRKAFVTRHAAGKPVVYWSTCHEFSSKPNSHYVNWNMLTYDPSVDKEQMRRFRKLSYASLLYYGSFRSNAGTRKKSDGTRVPYVGKNGRDAAFDRYFAEPAVKTVISSPAKDKFQERYGSDMIQYWGPIAREDFTEFLMKQGLGLYIEDRMSHEKFHSPANRFYEMLSAGLPMVFQPESATMLKRAGYDVTPYVVRDAAAVADMMDRRWEIGKAQHHEWSRDYRRELADQLSTARKAINL